MAFRFVPHVLELFAVELFADDFNKSSKFSIYSMAFLKISTLGNRWFGFGHVLFLSVSKASFTFRSRRRSLSVACFLLSGVELFFLQTLHAHAKHLRPFKLAVHTELEDGKYSEEGKQMSMPYETDTLWLFLVSSFFSLFNFFKLFFLVESYLELLCFDASFRDRTFAPLLFFILEFIFVFLTVLYSFGTVM